MEQLPQRQHRRATSSVARATTMVGLLLSAVAVGAQTVAPPSSSFATYVAGELIRDHASAYEATFRRVVGSIQIMEEESTEAWLCSIG